MKLSNLFNSAIVFISEHPKEISAGLALFASVLLSAKSSERKQPDVIDICLNAASDATMTNEEAVIKAIEAAALKDRADYYKNDKVNKIIEICTNNPDVVRVGAASVQRIMQTTSSEYYRNSMLSRLTRLL